jgi:hypothetical protein
MPEWIKIETSLFFTLPPSEREYVTMQSDQNGRINAYWVIVHLGQFFIIYKVANIFGLTFYTVKVMYVLILTKNRVGLHFGRFLTNPSGHPATMPQVSVHKN